MRFPILAFEQPAGIQRMTEQAQSERRILHYVSPEKPVWFKRQPMEPFESRLLHPFIESCGR
jgi:hypothetical protein